jgi:hypothetical protein
MSNYPKIEVGVTLDALQFVKRLEALVDKLPKVPTWTELTESEESYPDKHDWYMCFAISEVAATGGYRCICYYRGYGDWIDSKGDLITVTHWQTLPEPPTQ